MREAWRRWWWLGVTGLLLVVLALLVALGGFRPGEPYRGRAARPGDDIVTNHWTIRVEKAVLSSVPAPEQATEVGDKEAVVAVRYTVTNRTDAPRSFDLDGEIPVTVEVDGGELTQASCGRRDGETVLRGGPDVTEGILCYYTYRLSGLEQPPKGPAEVTFVVHHDNDADFFRDATATQRGDVVAHVTMTVQDIR